MSVESCFEIYIMFPEDQTNNYKFGLRWSNDDDDCCGDIFICVRAYAKL